MQEIELTYPESYEESAQPQKNLVTNKKVDYPDGTARDAAEITFLELGNEESERVATPENLEVINELAKKYGGENLQRNQNYPQWKVFAFANKSRRDNFKKAANEFLNGKLAEISAQGDTGATLAEQNESESQAELEKKWAEAQRKNEEHTARMKDYIVKTKDELKKNSSTKPATLKSTRG